MQAVLVALHLSISVALIIIVLLQTGKGSEIGAVFGSSSQTLFGSTGGSTFFGKLTTVVAIIFLLTSLILAGRATRVISKSVMTGVEPAATAPVTTDVETPAETPAAEEQTPAQAPAAEQETSADIPVAEQQTPASGAQEEGPK